LILGGAALLVGAPPLRAQQPIADATRTLEKRDGYFPLYWDAAKGRLLLEIPAGRLDQDFLYLPSLATGLGDAGTGLGLDRGTIGQEQIARFERVGPRVLLVLQNPQYRALSDNPALVRSVNESFPRSTVAAFEVQAEEGGRLLVDATSFVLGDLTDVRGRCAGPIRARSRSTATAARSSCRAPGRFPATPRSRPRSRSRATNRDAPSSRTLRRGEP
jgi:hypothetical protein